MDQNEVIRRAGQTPCVSCCDRKATTTNRDGDDVCADCKD